MCNVKSEIGLFHFEWSRPIGEDLHDANHFVLCICLDHEDRCETEGIMTYLNITEADGNEMPADRKIMILWESQ
jgi:hypothetical protein